MPSPPRTTSPWSLRLRGNMRTVGEGFEPSLSSSGTVRLTQAPGGDAGGLFHAGAELELLLFKNGKRICIEAKTTEASVLTRSLSYTQRRVAE